MIRRCRWAGNGTIEKIAQAFSVFICRGCRMCRGSCTFVIRGAWKMKFPQAITFVCCRSCIVGRRCGAPMIKGSRIICATHSRCLTWRQRIPFAVVLRAAAVAAVATRTVDGRRITRRRCLSPALFAASTGSTVGCPGKPSKHG